MSPARSPSDIRQAAGDAVNPGPGGTEAVQPPLKSPGRRSFTPATPSRKIVRLHPPLLPGNLAVCRRAHRQRRVACDRGGVCPGRRKQVAPGDDLVHPSDTPRLPGAGGATD